VATKIQIFEALFGKVELRGGNHQNQVELGRRSISTSRSHPLEHFHLGTSEYKGGRAAFQRSEKYEEFD